MKKPPQPGDAVVTAPGGTRFLPATIQYEAAPFSEKRIVHFHVPFLAGLGWDLGQHVAVITMADFVELSRLADVARALESDAAPTAIGCAIDLDTPPPRKEPAR